VRRAEHMKQKPERSQLSEGAFSILVLVLWFIAMAVGVVDMLVGRRLILELAIALKVNPWAHSAIDKFGFLILGVGWLITIYLVENVFSKAAQVGLRQLLRSFFIVVGAQVIFAVAAVLIVFLIA